jgi:hypothetical protein
MDSDAAREAVELIATLMGEILEDASGMALDLKAIRGRNSTSRRSRRASLTFRGSPTR